MNTNDLTQGSAAGTLFRFAGPFFIANVLQSLYGAADLFVVGAFCGAQSVAAVSTGTQVTQIVTSLITGLTLGSTVIIGQYTGPVSYTHLCPRGKAALKAAPCTGCGGERQHGGNSLCHAGGRGISGG